MSRRSDSTRVSWSRIRSMCSVLLRQRSAPITAAPRASANSVRWLPTNPVIPVIRIRTRNIVLHRPRLTSLARGPSETPPPAAGQGQRQERPGGECRAPPGVGAASHRPPAHPCLGAQPVVVTPGGPAAGGPPADHARLRQVRETRETAHPHPEIVVLSHRQRLVVAAGELHDRPPHHH